MASISSADHPLLPFPSQILSNVGFIVASCLRLSHEKVKMFSGNLRKKIVIFLGKIVVPVP